MAVWKEFLSHPCVQELLLLCKYFRCVIRSCTHVCIQVLTATSLKESVVYLCLKYVAMLLQLNPNMEGSEGSEYRLFVVALMLGKWRDRQGYNDTNRVY